MTVSLQSATPFETPCATRSRLRGSLRLARCGCQSRLSAAHQPPAGVRKTPLRPRSMRDAAQCPYATGASIPLGARHVSPGACVAVEPATLQPTWVEVRRTLLEPLAFCHCG